MTVVRHDHGPPPTRETQARAQAAWDRVLEPHPVQYPPTGLRCLVGSHADLLYLITTTPYGGTTRRRVGFHPHPASRGSSWTPRYCPWSSLAQTPLRGAHGTKLRRLGPGHIKYPCLEGVGSKMSGPDYLKHQHRGKHGSRNVELP